MKIDYKNKTIKDLTTVDAEFFAGWNALKSAVRIGEIHTAKDQVSFAIENVCSMKSTEEGIVEFPERGYLIDQTYQDFYAAICWKDFKQSLAGSEEEKQQIEELKNIRPKEDRELTKDWQPDFRRKPRRQGRELNRDLDF